MISPPAKKPLTIFIWWCLIIFCILHNILTFTWPVQPKEVLGRLSCRRCLIQLQSFPFRFIYIRSLTCTGLTKTALIGGEPCTKLKQFLLRYPNMFSARKFLKKTLPLPQKIFSNRNYPREKPTEKLHSQENVSYDIVPAKFTTHDITK